MNEDFLGKQMMKHGLDFMNRTQGSKATWTSCELTNLQIIKYKGYDFDTHLWITS